MNLGGVCSVSTARLEKPPKSSVWSSRLFPPVQTLHFHPPDRPATAITNKALYKNKKFVHPIWGTSSAWSSRVMIAFVFSSIDFLAIFFHNCELRPQNIELVSFSRFSQQYLGVRRTPKVLENTAADIVFQQIFRSPEDSPIDRLAADLHPRHRLPADLHRRPPELSSCRSPSPIRVYSGKSLDLFFSPDFFQIVLLKWQAGADLEHCRRHRLPADLQTAGGFTDRSSCCRSPSSASSSCRSSSPPAGAVFLQISITDQSIFREKSGLVLLSRFLPDSITQVASLG
ncbi:hypothetical protein KSP40_PGU012425 [Platanthera guangdongensis]|uniref:Uncharacterized protein n=1 Tax=Platanthera guangdongensis TaxID=2320717 RepID=A0ABR2LSX5_9ASPA